jgi:pimeloyl-ACP methyl ester carboxylesterase
MQQRVHSRLALRTLLKLPRCAEGWFAHERTCWKPRSSPQGRNSRKKEEEIMRRIGILMLALFTCLVSADWLQAQRPTPPPKVNPRIPDISRRPGVPQAQRLLLRAVPPTLPASVTRDVIQVPCPPEADALQAVCGNVKVPLDRKHPKQGTILINFELYTHTGTFLESAILVNFGGPGSGTTTSYRNFSLYLFGANLDVHDLLLIDDRGRGLSGTIDCEEVQHGTAPFVQAALDCAAQLGGAASMYGTGDIAQDTEAVRAALGYDKIDYFALSYGGADVVAYATRFGEHLRSIVLDAPYGGRVVTEFGLEEKYRTHAEPRMVSLDCLRSPTCSADHPLATAELDALIKTVRLWPVEGDAYDASGNLKHVRINETALLTKLIDNPTGLFTSTGELLAAARSLWLGDPKPLLRLGAEGYYSLDFNDYGDPTVFSYGALLATADVDVYPPWDWSAQVPMREAQFAHAVSKLPFDYFAPFSKTAATSLDFSFTKQDLYWEKPTPSSPIVPPHPRYPYIPVLVLTGDMDSRVPSEEVRDVASHFPNHTLVPVAEAGHTTVFWTQCGANLASEFIENLWVADTSCASTPETVWSAVGRFPLLAKDARPSAVDPNGGNQIGAGERKVATVAVATATDAMQRSIIGSGNGFCLREGSFQTEYGAAWTTTLNNCAFAKDVTVNGTVTWEYAGSFVADLTVSGPGTAGGTLHVVGTWQAPGPVGNFNVSGTLGGKQVAVLVPEA